MKKITTLTIVSLLFLSSCLSDLNLDPDTNFTYPGHWSAPLVNARISLNDLVQDQEYLSTDSTGLVHIVYREEDLYTEYVYKFTEVPTQAPTEAGYLVGTQNISIGSNLNTFGDAKMKKISVFSGLLKWKTDNPISDTIAIKLTLLNTELDDTVAFFPITTYTMGLDSGEFDIAGLEFDLTKDKDGNPGTPPWNNIGFEFIEDTSLTTAPAGTQMGLTLQFENLFLNSAVGYLGNRTQLIPSYSTETNLGELENIAEGLYIKNPVLKLFTKSNIGLDLGATPKIVGIGRKGVVDLELDSLFLAGSPQEGTFIYDTISINTTNSKIDKFFENIPSIISFSGAIETNPNGEPPQDNFVTYDGVFSLGMEVDLPLELSTSDLTLEYDIEELDFGVDEDETDFVEQLTLGFRIENAFPLDADLRIMFFDSLDAKIDSVEIALFKSANVDSDGNVTSPYKEDIFKTFTNSQIKGILESKKINIKTVMNTANGGTQTVKLKGNSYIDILLAADVKLNYNTAE